MAGKIMFQYHTYSYIKITLLETIIYTNILLTFVQMMLQTEIALPQVNL